MKGFLLTATAMTWLGCVPLPHEREILVRGFGSPGPIVPQVVAPDGSWLTACQARADSNGDGTISIAFDQHGGLVGDDAQLYFFSER